MHDSLTSAPIICTVAARKPDWLWTAETETEIFNRVIERCAPEVPIIRTAKRYPVCSPSERSLIWDHWTWIAGHDTHIVRSLAKALDLFGPQDQPMILRQMADDGDHAAFLRTYIAERTGTDPIRKINDVADQHADILGDLPWRDRDSFFAWELHYELYILARLMLERRRARLYDPDLQPFALDKIGPDEEAHRLGIMNWFLADYRSRDAATQEKIAYRVVSYDNEIQRRLRSYLTFRYRQSELSMDTNITHAAAIYDGFRYGVLQRVLGIRSDGIGELVILGDIV